MPFKKKNVVRRRPRKSSVRRPRRVGVSPAVKKYVKRTIHSNIENKIINTRFVSNVGVSTGHYYTSLILSPSQSTLQNGRIGNQISIRKGIFRTVVSAKPYSTLTNYTYHNCYRMVIYSQKKAHAYDSTIFNSFFQNGSSSSAPQGNMYDITTPLNRDVITVHKDIKFNLGVADLPSGSNTPYSLPLTKLMTINTTKYLKKKHLYNDGVDTPTNDNLFMVLFVVAGTFNGGTIAPAYIYNELEITYEDA